MARRRQPCLPKCRLARGGEDIRRALRVYARACLLLWLVAGGLAWAR
ncbi:MAG: hypothetical protein IH998_10475 [Proteobacteria bacterium]|nr:hypothetical protein [Pseudomonadota bacterium]